MKRAFVEIEDGVVVAVHEAEVKANRGVQAKDPKTTINKRKPTNEVKPHQSANKGDRIINGQICRPLPKR